MRAVLRRLASSWGSPCSTRSSIKALASESKPRGTSGYCLACLPPRLRSAPRMKVIVKLARHRLADPGRLLEVVQRRAFDSPCGAEVHQQRALAVGTDPRNFIERRRGQALRPLRPVSADRKSVRFVA